MLFDGESVQQSAVLPVWMEIYMERKVFFTNKCHEIIEHIPQVIERPFPVRVQLSTLNTLMKHLQILKFCDVGYHTSSVPNRDGHSLHTV